MKALFLSLVLAASARAAVLPQPSALGSIQGRVTLDRRGVSNPARIGPGPVSFKAGDVLRTGRGADAYVAFPDGSRVVLGPGSVVIVKAYADRAVELFLKLGEIKAKVSKRRGRLFSVHTAAVVASVRGTEFTVRAEATGATAVSVREGLVSVKAHKRTFWTPSEVVLSAGESVLADDSGLGRVVDASRREEGWAVPGSDLPKR